ncbi:MAG: HAMP domain-containing histidine kinase [Bacteroidaceae bacterium]|nr:HAMP domain-containing histidine kinase [Bacteroidaceae bacterium]
MIDYLLNITLMADSEAAQLQWIVSTQQWTVLALMILLVAVPLLMYSRYQRLNARRQREVDDQLARRNRELAEAKSRAEEASRMKTEFIHLVTREIRTPLSTVVGFSQVLADFDIDITEEEMRDMIRRIVADAWAVTRIIDRMLDMSEVLGLQTLACNDCVTAAEIADEAANLSGIREAGHVDFSIEAVGDSGAVALHTNRLHAVRALVQLLDNAGKFTRENDDPDYVAALPPRSQTVRLLMTTAGGGMVSFLVEDTGIGVPRDQADRIFGQFVQLNEFREGTGIGLAVARHTARMLGGDVWLDTAYPSGARFVMALRIDREYC